MDIPTRVGLGGTALFTLAGITQPLFGWVVSGPLMVLCALVAAWGFWPLILSRLPSKQRVSDYWKGPAKTHFALAGMLALGLGIGSLMSGNGGGEFWRFGGGRVVWNFDAAARGGGFFLGMFKTSAQEIRVLGFQAHGKNSINAPIHQFSGWMRSDITNSTKPIYILGQDNDESKIQACIPRIPTTFDDTYGIPALADFDVVTFEKTAFGTNDGISVATFLSAVAPFTVHIESDGETVERQFSIDEVKKQIDLFGQIAALQNVPRVIRKDTAPKPQMPPLTPLVKATPVPSLKLFVPPDSSDLTGAIRPKN